MIKWLSKWLCSHGYHSSKYSFRYSQVPPTAPVIFLEDSEECKRCRKSLKYEIQFWNGEGFTSGVVTVFAKNYHEFKDFVSFFKIPIRYCRYVDHVEKLKGFVGLTYLLPNHAEHENASYFEKERLARGSRIDVLELKEWRSK